VHGTTPLERWQRVIIHPAAELFPRLADVELEALAADVRANGLRLPIVTYRGQVLDGRNRLRACELAGVAPRFEEYAGDDPVGFVVSTNLKRRHLDESQRAMVAGRMVPLLEAEARARMLAGRDPSANLREGGDAAGGAGKGRANLPEGGKAAEQAARMVNVGPRSVESARAILTRGTPELAEAVDRGKVAVSNAAVLADEPAAEQRAVVARSEREILAAAKAIKARKNEERRTERFAKLAAIACGNRPLAALTPRGPWPIILADPPWRYEHCPGGEHHAIENHYPTMALEEICAMPIGEIATRDAMLFLWAPGPKLAEAMRVIEAWGFDYRSRIVWVKPRAAPIGQYVQQRCEELLIAMRGSVPVPAPENRPDSVLEAARREHSRKPDEQYAIIDRMYPGLPRVELFARTRWPGWDVWGNQAPAEEAA
jgi:N6-adenosine-specific RNA methylase IME4